MKLLDGKELAGFVKERQSHQVRGLRQAWKVFPRLALVATGSNPVIGTYMRLKQAYGEDILVTVDVHTVAQDQVAALIATLNADPNVHGIVLQLPLDDPSVTDELVGLIAPAKDVDGLGGQGPYVSATATAIDWLLAGYNVSLSGARIAIVGQGRLVGAPLAKLWLKAGLDVYTYDDSVTDLRSELRQADIIVTATGVPGLLSADMVGVGAVVVDAGTAVENGQLVGDVAPDLRERQDITITPLKGGVGPLTVAALFEQVIAAARAGADSSAATNQD